MTTKADLDTIFVALDRLRVLGFTTRYGGGQPDINLANRGLIALENVRKYVANSVPFEQGAMFEDGE